MSQTPADPGPGSRTRTPTWVKVFGIAIGGLLLLLVVAMFAGGDHGPGRHRPEGGTPSSGRAGAPTNHAPPAGGHR